MNLIDPQETFDRAKKAVVEQLTQNLQLEGRKKSLHVSNIRVVDELDPGDFKSQAEARGREKTWGVPIIGDVELRDKESGKVIDRKRGIRLAVLPKPTQRFSFIVNGTEYSVANQLRLRPGAYTIPQGSNIRTQVNTAKGVSYDIRFDPKKQRWMLAVGRSKSRSLYDVLLALGVTESQMKKTLGEDGFQAMKSYSKPGTITGLYQTIYHRPAESPEEAAEGVREHFNKVTRMDPETTKMTLGRPFTEAGGPLMLAVAKKQLAVSQGKAEFDARDSMTFKEVRMLDDHLKSRLEYHIGPNHADGRKWRRYASQRIDRADNAIHALHAVDVRGPLKKFFLGGASGSALVQSVELRNPVAQIDAYTTTTIKGEGGIRSDEAVTNEARSLHPSVFGIMDPLHTPESQEVGATTHLGSNVARTKDGNVAARLVDARTGKEVTVTSAKTSQSVIAFPEHYEIRKGQKPRALRRQVRALQRGEVSMVSPSKVDYVMADGRSMFDPTLNMVPWLQAVSGSRGVMAAKMMGQALSLVDSEREAPLVQTEAPSGKTFEREVASLHLPKAPFDGKVTRVMKDWIEVTGAGGEKKRVGLYNMFRVGTSNQFHHNKPKVKTGDEVKKGQVLADSNFTVDGQLSLGKNLTVAYLPFRGLNFEDGIVMSESAARKMRSAHLHRLDLRRAGDMVFNTKKYRVMFPGRWPASVYAKFEENGLPKIGARFSEGEPVILAMIRDVGHVSESQAQVRRLMKRPYRDVSVTWDEPHEGEVKHVFSTAGRVAVELYAEHGTQVGDKFAGRYGNKGVVTKIVPDNEMPQRADGTAVDVLLNPLGVPGRINPAQLFETAVAKAGKPYVVRNLQGGNADQEVDAYLKQEGVEGRGYEDLQDPTTGKRIPHVNVGTQYVMKLDHEAEKKHSYRGIGAYSLDETPAKSDETRPQKLDHLTLFSMLGHGARANIRDMSTYKASRNDEVWRAIVNGDKIPPPKPMFAWGKMEAYLRQLGVNVKREGDRLRLMPMTDDEILAQSAGEIRDARFVRARDLKAEPGSLFDPAVTGGLRGKKWSHFTLPEAIPNPTFEAAIQSITGINRADYQSIMRGESGLRDGKVVPYEEANLRRGEAIRELLTKVDVTSEIKAAREEIAGTTDTSRRDKAYKRLRFLQNLERLKVSPEKAFMMKAVPVIPPIYRPMYTLPGGELELPPINYLYREAILLRNQIKDAEKAGLPDEIVDEARSKLYQSVSAIQGYDDALSRKEELKGVMRVIKGPKPKAGWFQKTLYKKKQDLSGRAPIVNGPDLHIDEVGLPEDMAWGMYEQFVIAELVKGGMTPLQAKEAVTTRTPAARRALERVTADRPVFLNRAPSLHRHSIMAFKPVLSSGKSLRLHPFVYKGFNADNDGDAMAVHVPFTPEAVREAEEFLPSKHVFSVRGQLLTAPSMESQWGLWLLTKDGKKTNYRFSSFTAAVDAYKAGKIDLTDQISVSGTDTTIGRLIVNKGLPRNLQDPELKLTKDKVREIIEAVALKNPKALPAMLDHFARLGYETAYETGATIGLDDIRPLTKEREKSMQRARARAKKMDVVDAYTPVIEEMNQAIRDAPDTNEMVAMLRSGAIGKWTQARQILTAPVLFNDTKGDVVRSPVERSFSEGLEPGEYWSSLYGARMGVIGRASSTKDPGALANALIQTTIDNVITKLDCGTNRGVTVDTAGNDALFRFPAQPVPGVPMGTAITKEALAKLRKMGVHTVRVRSPLTCLVGAGTCAMCWGLNENQQLPRIGTNVGVLSGHAMTEPSTQLAMNTFHTGGVYEPGISRSDSFNAMEQLLQMSDNVPDRATIARVKGRVEKVEERKTGGRDIWVAGKRHFVPSERKVRAGIVGKRVVPGESLTDGIKDPKELASVTSLPLAQEYIARELRDIYRSGGMNVPAKHFETVVRSAAGDVQVTRDPTGSFEPGQDVSFSQVDAINHKRAKPISGKALAGAMLMERVPGLDHLYGRVLGREEAKAVGKRRVLATKDPIKYVPRFRGVYQSPQRQDDWIARLTFRGLEPAIRQGAAMGMESNLHGLNPLPATVFGSEIQTKPGRRGEY